MLTVSKPGDTKLYLAYYNGKNNYETPPFGYVFAETEKEASDKAFELAKKLDKEQRVIFKLSKEKWKYKQSYEDMYPVAEKKKDIFVIMVNENEIVV